MKVKQEPTSREYDIHKRFNIPRFPGTSFNKHYRGIDYKYRSTCLTESPSLDVREAKVMLKQRRLSAFFGQQHKEETAQTFTANEEAEP